MSVVSDDGYYTSRILDVSNGPTAQPRLSGINSIATSQCRASIGHVMETRPDAACVVPRQATDDLYWCSQWSDDGYIAKQRLQ